MHCRKGCGAPAEQSLQDATLSCLQRETLGSKLLACGAAKSLSSNPACSIQKGRLEELEPAVKSRWLCRRGQAVILAHPDVPGVTVTSSPSRRMRPSLYQVISAAGWDWALHASETLPLMTPSMLSGFVPTIQGASAPAHPRRQCQRRTVTTEAEVSPGGNAHRASRLLSVPAPRPPRMG